MPRSSRGFPAIAFSHTNKGHGRIETRTCWSTGELHHLKDIGHWEGLASVVAMDATRSVQGKVTQERRYYISSLDGEDAKALAEAIRMHWGVANPLHWILDVHFKEDQSRVRKGHGAENLPRLRRIALNKLQAETSRKRSIRAKRLRAGWDHDYLLHILQI